VGKIIPNRIKAVARILDSINRLFILAVMFIEESKGAAGGVLKLGKQFVATSKIKKLGRDSRYRRDQTQVPKKASDRRRIARFRGQSS
jgi:hypothetical protein